MFSIEFFDKKPSRESAFFQKLFIKNYAKL